MCSISGFPLVRAAVNGKLLFAFWALWLEEALTLLISLAIVKMNVFGFEFAINESELRDTRHVSAIGDNGK